MDPNSIKNAVYIPSPSEYEKDCFCNLCGMMFRDNMMTTTTSSTTNITMVNLPLWDKRKHYNEHFCPECLEDLHALVKMRRELKKL